MLEPDSRVLVTGIHVVARKVARLYLTVLLA